MKNILKLIKRPRKKGIKEISVITAVFCVLFAALAGYLLFYLVALSRSFVNSPYNQKRINNFAEDTRRGSILSSDGKELAYTEVLPDGTEERVYPYGREYAHVVGFNSNGKAGLEAAANYYLLNSHAGMIDRIRNSFTEESDPGDDLITTLDSRMQDAASEALGYYDGAVVVMKPETGEILAMVSHPDFDPNRVIYDYEALAAEEDSGVLINRGTQGRYAPGSTFKLLTTLEFLRENPGADKAFSFSCEGVLKRGTREVHCYNYKAHGEETLLTAFGNSCNAAFADIGLGLDAERFARLCDDFFFDRPIEFDLPTEKSFFLLNGDSSGAERMETAIGQGKTLVTPLQMLLIASAVDCGGKAARPVIMDEIVSATNRRVKKFQRGVLRQVMTEEEAALLREYMRFVVTDGTGHGLMNDSYSVYGKTGTAEYDSRGSSHAWFVGFAEKEDREDIAVAVILEGAGSGSGFAVPAAKKVFDAWFAL